MGAATTSVAVYEEGDLQYVGVVPAGSNNITNDLAIVLAIDPEMAEEIKTRFVTGKFDSEKNPVIRVGKEGKVERAFERKEVEDVVKARLEEIFGEVRKKLKAARYDQRLPEGIILTGGGAKMRDIELFAKNALEASVKVGIPQGFGGISEAIAKPEYAVAAGLAQAAGRVALGVDVRQQHPLAQLGHAGGQVHGGGGLAHPALLIGDADDLCQGRFSFIVYGLSIPYPVKKCNVSRETWGDDFFFLRLFSFR